ncbi:metallophosphoesterase [Lichenihabitans sp. PAMC28606]|uniref:metallophosphoesterase n=1 Tax=Lichenihabitans sp. PAMC28606 TaxID=2880932 RepID=UPI001D0B64B6|nr:metallophosphoesterase [Lichenihabitans sp. PAMC28606]UDL93210.1 metallophosphoesterase [Lichenihabitans sp. PAMC28606]
MRFGNPFKLIARLSNSDAVDRHHPDAMLPDGTRVYAIGDIHGRADLLDAMVSKIADDVRERPVDQPLTVLLGDYIDRGPRSAEVIDRLARNDFATPIVTLTGNHEDIFGQVLRGSASLDRFLGMGGDATLRSYGLDPRAMQRMRTSDRQAALRGSVSPSHRAFLEATRLSFTVGRYFFCHAGARPGVPLDEQSREDLVWIREDFLKSPFDFGKIIVHGHTPVKTPEVRSNAINVDTKAFASGVLTAVVLEGNQRRFLQVRV